MRPEADIQVATVMDGTTFAVLPEPARTGHCRVLILLPLCRKSEHCRQMAIISENGLVQFFIASICIDCFLSQNGLLLEPTSHVKGSARTASRC